MNLAIKSFVLIGALASAVLGLLAMNVVGFGPGATCYFDGTEIDSPAIGVVAEIAKYEPGDKEIGVPFYNLRITFSDEYEFEKGDRLDVIQGNETIAHVIVTKVKGNECFAETDGTIFPEQAIKPDATVFKDTTLQCVAACLPEPKADLDIKAEVAKAKALAIQHATADAKLGHHRLLNYGRASTDKIDKETQLPLVSAAGCLVSEQLVAFVRQYNETIKTEHKKLLAMNAEKEQRLLGIDGFVPPIAGTISKVSEADPKVVHLDIGSENGIAIEDRLAICRDGWQDFGLLIVKKVEKNSAEATISYVRNEAPLVKGDQVLKDTTLDVSNDLMGAKGMNAKQLASQHAEADLELGVKRILFFGKPVADTRRKDDASKLPMVMNGGCVVSEDLIVFTEEYNRLMRANASK